MSKNKQSALALIPRTSSAVSTVDELFGGKILPTKKAAASKTQEKLVEKLPEDLEQMSDVLVAGRKLSREIDYKLQFTENKFREYCLHRFAFEYAAVGKRPLSSVFAGKNSSFTYVQTRRGN